MSLFTMLDNIDPEKTYSAYAILQLGVMGKMYPTVIKKIMADKLGSDLLKAEIEGDGTTKRYKIKGEHLISYLGKDEKNI